MASFEPDRETGEIILAMSKAIHNSSSTVRGFLIMYSVCGSAISVQREIYGLKYRVSRLGLKFSSTGIAMSYSKDTVVARARPEKRAGALSWSILNLC